jgi:hypothetical protein
MVALFNTFYDKWDGLHMGCDSVSIDNENPTGPFCSMDSFSVIFVYLN